MFLFFIYVLIRLFCIVVNNCVTIKSILLIFATGATTRRATKTVIFLFKFLLLIQTLLFRTSAYAWGWVRYIRAIFFDLSFVRLILCNYIRSAFMEQLYWALIFRTTWIFLRLYRQFLLNYLIFYMTFLLSTIAPYFWTPPTFQYMITLNSLLLPPTTCQNFIRAPTLQHLLTLKIFFLIRINIVLTPSLMITFT